MVLFETPFPKNQSKTPELNIQFHWSLAELDFFQLNLYENVLKHLCKIYFMI